MSHEDLLAQALWGRLAGDASLLALAPAGVHFGRVGNLAHMPRWTLVGTVPTALAAEVLDPTWLEFSIASGGAEEERPGGWTDVIAAVAAKSRRSPADCFLAEARADELLYGWRPSLGTLAAFPADKVGDDHAREVAAGDPGLAVWVQSGLWRFRYGPP